ncbi:MAG: histidine kinase [Deltaproteobacteria bacterium]|nr:histidine kinase [Deltaproteobacteria bacterium]
MTGLRFIVCASALTTVLLFNSKANASVWSVPWRAGAEARDVITLGTPSVTLDIAQTRDGYVWLAAMNGLFRYDGDRLAKQALEGDVPAVRKLMPTRRGQLWVAGGGGYLDVDVGTGDPFLVGLREGHGGLFVLEQGQTKRILPADDAPAHWVWSMGELADGRVVAGTENGLWLIDPRDGQSTPVAAPVPAHARHVAALLVQSTAVGEIVWFANAAGVWRWTVAGRQPPELVFAMVGVRDVVFARGGFWIVQDAHLHRVKEGVIVQTIAAAAGEQFRSFLDSEGEPPWVGTTFGLQRLRDGKLNAADETLPKQTVRALMRDREGNVWAACKGSGAALLRVPAVHNLGQREGLPADVVLSLLPQTGAWDAMWAATREGLVHISRGEITARPMPQEAPDWRLRNLAQQSDGTLWAGFDRLGRYKDGRTSVISPDALGGRVRALAVDPKRETLWLGFLEGGAKAFRHGDLLQPEPVPQGLCPGPVNGIVPAQGGEVWFLSPRGVALLPSDATNARCYPIEGLGSTSVTGLVQDGDGTAWITATGSHGLLRLSHDVVTAVPRAAEFPPSSLYAAARDSRGSLWFSSYQGVFNVQAEALDRWTRGEGPVPLVFHVDNEAGMRSADCQTSFGPTLVPWGDGGVMVATALGVAAIKPAHALPRPHIEPVVDVVFVDGVPINAAHVIPPGAQRIEIRYSAPTFVAGAKPRFEQRLDGVDATWRAVGELRSALFAKLPARDYALRIRIVGEPQRSAVVAFKVLAPWYRRPLFLVMVVVAVLALFVLFYRWRINQLAAGFNAITKERTRIARDWHDGLSQVFLGIGYQLEAMRMRLAKGTVTAADPSLLTIIDEAAAMIKGAQQDVKKTLWDLRDGDGDKNRFLALFDELAHTSRKRFNVNVQIKVSGTLPRAGQITEEWPRIAQEAVTNAVRHGKAKNIFVVLAFDGPLATLTIDDDGIGVQPTSGNRGSFGLVGMRERAARCGGTLVVEPAPGGVGTRLQVVVDSNVHGKQRHSGVDRG